MPRMAVLLLLTVVACSKKSEYDGSIDTASPAVVGDTVRVEVPDRVRDSLPKDSARSDSTRR